VDHNKKILLQAYWWNRPDDTGTLATQRTVENYTG
jgi:hypothetical protein